MFNKRKKEAEAQAQQEQEMLLAQQQMERENAAKKEEEERKKNRPVAMEEYYNIAYAKERKRLNDLFGRLDYDNTYIPEETKVVEKVVYKEPDEKLYVPVQKYERKKSLLSVFVATTVIFGALAIFLALNTFVLHLF